MTITLYSQPGCGPCVGIKGLLNRKGHDFTEVDIRQDESAAVHIRSLGATGTPFLTIGDEHYASVSDMRDRIATL